MNSYLFPQLLLDAMVVSQLGVLATPVGKGLIRLVAATLHVVYISLVMHAALVAQALRALSVMSF